MQYVRSTFIVLAACSISLLIAASLSIVVNSTFDIDAAHASTQSKKSESATKAKSDEKAKKKIVAIDPGHTGKTPRGTEQVAPGSRSRKAKCTSGTAGRYTHVPEYKVTMKVALKLKKILVKRGYKVVLTRKSNSDSVSNVQRAKRANKAKANIYIRLHCDGAGSSGAHGISMQNPGKGYKWPRANYKKSAKLAKCILNSTCKMTGASKRGIFYRNDLSGNNWAKMPVTLIEMGFMSNPSEDRKLVKDSYQNKLAKGIANGIDKYFGIKRKS